MSNTEKKMVSEMGEKMADKGKWEGYVILANRGGWWCHIGTITQNCHISGYIYIYPSKSCAEYDVDRLKRHGWKSKFKVVPAIVTMGVMSELEEKHKKKDGE